MTKYLTQMTDSRWEVVVPLCMPVAADLQRLRGEFLSMPGLCLTVRQAARLVSVDEHAARALLDALVQEAVLVHAVGGIYRRALH